MLFRILLPTRHRDDIDSDGPRVANGKRKQRQHTGSDQGESELGGAEEQTTEHIREKERVISTHIPIIALTAHAMAGDRERFMAAGMDGYVTKPIRVPELLNEIERMLGRPDEGSCVDLSLAS